MAEIEMINKQNIRTKYLNLRNNLSLSERKEKSRKIWDKLMAEPSYQKAQAVLVYMDYRSEVMTTGLVEELFKKGEKRVFAPRVEGMDIHFYEVHSMEDFESGYQGIREPKEDWEKLFTLQMMSEMKGLVLVPGAVFDRQRGRMGYGKGFYDRFLAEYIGLNSVALAFSCQIAKRVPVEEHDIRPDLIITEDEMIR